MSYLLIICLIAGCVASVLQGMLGIGTGVLIVPLLTFLLPKYGVDEDVAMHSALATSMATIATNSISALISHYHHGNVKIQFFKRIILFSICGSCLGAFIASCLSVVYLKTIFGIFLLLTAIYILFREPAESLSNSITDLPTHQIAAGGFSIGLISSIIGSGGGILMVPFLHALKFEMRYAVGTSTLIGLPVAVIGALSYIIIGLFKINLTTNTIGYLHWPAFLAITSAGILFAPLGVKLSTILNTRLLNCLFAIIIIIVGMKMIMNY